MAKADQLIKEAESAAKRHVECMPGDTTSAGLLFQVGYLEGIVRHLCNELKANSNPPGCFETIVDGVVIGVADNGPDEAPDFMIGGQVVGDVLSYRVQRQIWRDFEAHLLAERQEAA